MTAEHNHPPRCCCDPHLRHVFDSTCPECLSAQRCPDCPEHGDLATPYTEQETTNG